MVAKKVVFGLCASLSFFFIFSSESFGQSGSMTESQCREMEQRSGMICELQLSGQERVCHQGVSQQVCRDVPGGLVCGIENGRRICRQTPARRECSTIPGQQVCEMVSKFSCICKKDPWGNTYPTTPGPIPPVSMPHNDLAGFCMDNDHSQFQRAKDFAYSANGLDLPSKQEAINWALEYNRTHSCNTISIFKERFNLLFAFSYNVKYMDASSKAQARNAALEWINRGYCGDENAIQQMIRDFTPQFNFAYSSNGLDMATKLEARMYALDQLAPMFSCVDVFRNLR